MKSVGFRALLAIVALFAFSFFLKGCANSTVSMPKKGSSQATFSSADHTNRTPSGFSN
jgi:hypothetical protein